MRSLLFYLLQVFISSGLLYGYYHFILRNKRFHHYNRFYLLAATVMSLVIPFLNIPLYFTESEKESLVIQTLSSISFQGKGSGLSPVVPVTEGSSWFSLQNIFYLLYAIIGTLLFSRILFSLVKIWRIKRSNPVKKLDAVYFVNTDEPSAPFSFFRWLFWNKRIELNSGKGEQLFRHELFHIEQKHSRDIIYMELLTVVFWINPFFHLIKKEIRAIHEFLADRFAIGENKKWEYAELLLMQAFQTNQQLVNPFFNTYIKRRIAMITNSTKPSYQYLRKLMVLPVTALVVFLFAFSYKVKNKTAMARNNDPVVVRQLLADTGTRPLRDTLRLQEIKPDNIVNAPWAAENNLIIIDGVERPGITIAEVDKLLKAVDIYSVNVLKGRTAIDAYGAKGRNGVVVINTKKASPGNSEMKLQEIRPDLDTAIVPGKLTIEPYFPGGEKNWKKYLQQNINALVPVDKGAPAGSYTVAIQFLVSKDGSLSDIKPLTNHGYGMEQEVVRLISKGPRWEPVMIDGKYLAAYKKQLVTFEVSEEAGKTKSVVTTRPLEKVESEARFPGGETKWKQYLEYNFNKSVLNDPKIPKGDYTVVIQFIVDDRGDISDIRPLTKFGYGMEEEAVRMIAKGPKWSPAFEKGNPVTSYKKQLITFVVGKERYFY